MKFKQLTVTSLLVLASASVFAGNDRSVSYQYGTVLDAAPIVKHITVTTPREECWEEEVVRRSSTSGSGLSTVIGAVVGGAIGNAVGHKKKNKQVGAVLGAVLGGTIAHSASAKGKSGSVYKDTEQVCRVYNESHEEERVVGYNVRYRYNDDVFNTRTDTNPGDTIKLRVAVTPVI